MYIKIIPHTTNVFIEHMVGKQHIEKTFIGYTVKEAVELFCNTYNVNPDVTYHRKPTPGEIKFGHGATHYRDFKFTDCINPDGTLKKRLKADDGLIYTR